MNRRKRKPQTASDRLSTVRGNINNKISMFTDFTNGLRSCNDELQELQAEAKDKVAEYQNISTESANLIKENNVIISKVENLLK